MVVMAFGLKRDNSNGTSAAISQCGVTAIEMTSMRIALAGLLAPSADRDGDALGIRENLLEDGR